jgi:hypothetical protein
MIRNYECVVYQDRALFARLRGLKLIDTFTAGLDLDNLHSPEAFESLQATLLGAAHRHRGDRADITRYRMYVNHPESQEAVVRNYRCATRLASADDLDG